MKDNKIIDENSTNTFSDTQSKSSDSFMTSNTSGFLNSNKHQSKKELSSNTPEPQMEVSTDINVEKRIDEVEVGVDEFGNNSIHMNTELEIPNAIHEEPPFEVTETPNLLEPNLDAQLANNPSSIFNIPLISSDDTSTTTTTNTSTNDSTPSNELKNNELQFNTPPDNVDYFSFQFTQPVEETPNVVAETPTVQTTDNLENFGFSNVITPKQSEEVIPVQEDHIELTNFLQPKENLIKKAEEIDENNNNGIRDNNVIYVNDDTASDMYHNKSQLIKVSLYSFYILLGVLVIVFAYRIYKSNTDFKLARSEITLAINSTYQAEIIANAKVQDNTKYEWTSSDPNIVQVDENGLITSVGGGEATITVKKANKTKTLKVTAINIEIESITFKEQLITLKVGEEKTLQAIINNDETIVIDLLWESSDTNIVTVDQNGRVTAVGVGQASIYVYDEVSGLGGEIAIDILPADNGDKGDTEKPKDDKDDGKNIAVTGIALNKSDTIMEVGEYIVVSAVVRPANASNKTVTWSSSNTNVATVSSSGKITAKKVGTATITATTKNGKRASIKITVTEKFVKVTGITLNKETLSLNVGEAADLTATIKPSNASNKGINWSSSDETVVTVSENGKVIAKGAGTATITATTKDGNKKAVCKVTVKEKEIIAVDSITLNKTTLELDIGGTATLTATIKPDNATYPDVTWESSDTNVVEVVNGKVTAKGSGKATITAVTNNGKKATCSVTVKEKTGSGSDSDDETVEVTGVKLNETEIYLYVGNTFKLSATITPNNATNKALTWISSKSEYASVENGVVTAKKVGDTVITVKTANGKTATCKVYIIEDEEIEEEEEEEPEKPTNPDPGTENPSGGS